MTPARGQHAAANPGPGPGQPVPFTLTPKGLAALAAVGPQFCPEALAADRPRYCDPGDCCRDAFSLAPDAPAADGGFPPIVCLCGSTRFVAEFNRQRRHLTERGQIVLAIEVVTTQARQDDPQHADPALKARLDELHKRKIDLADYVLILNVGGYIGESTRSEIAYAAALGKPVRYLEPPAAVAGPVMDCGCGYDDCPACAEDGWACQRCGLAFFGTRPEHGLCPGCAGGGR